VAGAALLALYEMTYVLAFGIPGLVAGVGVAFGIAKDGRPWRKEWWT